MATEQKETRLKDPMAQVLDPLQFHDGGADLGAVVPAGQTGMARAGGLVTGMQGDIITRIRQYHPYIGHYHLAGVPGRNEMDDTQELNYPAILRAILETRYTGYVGQEFIPRRDPIQSLRESARICDV